MRILPLIIGFVTIGSSVTFGSISRRNDQPPTFAEWLHAHLSFPQDVLIHIPDNGGKWETDFA